MEKTYNFSIIERTPAGSIYSRDRDSDSPSVLVRHMDIGMLVKKLKEHGIRIDSLQSEKKFRDDNGIITAKLTEEYKGDPIELTLRAPPLGLELHLKDYHHSDVPSDPMEIKIGMRYASEAGIVCTLKYNLTNEEQCKKAEVAVRETQKQVYDKLSAHTPSGSAIKRMVKSLKKDPKFVKARAELQASLSK